MAPVSVSQISLQITSSTNTSQTLTHASLIEHCVEHLFLHEKGTAIGYTYNTLSLGFEVLHTISLE
jgi:hypothetical protein